MEALKQIVSYLQQLTSLSAFTIYVKTSRDHEFRDVYRFGNKQALTLKIKQTSKHERFVILQRKKGSTLVFFLTDDFYASVVISGPTGTFGNQSMEHLWLLFQLYTYQSLLHMKDAELTSLFEGIRSISSSLELEELIKKIITNALTVIDVADAGLLHLYDASINRLVPKAAVGFDERAIQHFRMRVGESIAGKVFQDGKARIYYTQPEATQGMSDISQENYDFLNSAKALSEMKGLICVPISVGTERIGVLVLHQFQAHGKLVEHDLQLLQGFADQTAIAIENARLYREAKTAMQELTELSGQLQSRNQSLLKRTEIHDTLQQLTLLNKGVEAIIQTLQQMIGKPVTFIDCLQNEYYPPSALNRPTLSIDELSMIFSNRRTPVMIQIGKNESTSRYAFPIMNGAVFFGCLAVETKFFPLPELDQITIEQGSAILTLELVKQQTISSIFYKKTHEFFQELLQEKDQDTLYLRGMELGLSPSAAYSVVLFQLTSAHDLQHLDASVHRLVAMLKRRHKSIEQLVYGFHNHVTMLVSIPDKESASQLKSKLQPTVKEWEQIEDTALSIGIGGFHYGIEQIKKSYEEAKKAVTYLINRLGTGIVRYEELGVNRLMINQSQSEIDSFVYAVFRPFREQPDKYQELEKTLRLYVKHNYSAQLTAKALHLHYNTLYQRLKKIEEILGIDLDNSEEMLKIQLACYLMDQFGAG